MNRLLSQSPDLRDGSIDARLLLLALVTPRGVTFTHKEIADVCGCSRGLIWMIEKAARKKLRQEFERRGLSVQSFEVRSDHLGEAQDVVSYDFEIEAPASGLARESGEGTQTQDVVLSARRRRRRTR